MTDEAFCPNCGAILNDQDGFDPDGDRWTCTSCGTALFEPDAEEGMRFDDVFWVCDSCGASLSSQPGFTDMMDEWMCLECGYTNRIAEGEILEDGEEWDQSAFDMGMRRDEYGNWSWSSGEDENAEDDNDRDEQETYSSWASSSDNDTYSRDYYETSRATREIKEQAKALRELNDEIERQQHREAQERRREFAKRHWKGIIVACGLVVLLSLCAYAGYEYQKLRTVGMSSSEAVGQPYGQVRENLEAAGFTNVSCTELCDLDEENIAEDGRVSEVDFSGNTSFESDSKYPYDIEVAIEYHSISMAAPPYSGKEAKGKDYREVEQAFRDAGFFNVRAEARSDSLVGLVNKRDAVESVTIDGDARYPDGQEYRANSEVVVYYHALMFG